MLPTVSAFGAAPGDPTVHWPGPSLPAAVAITSPASLAASSACESASAPSEQPGEPSERLTTLIPYVALFATTHWRALISADDDPLPAESRIFTPTSAAPGATPRYFRSGRASPSPARMPATCVPWPWSS